MGSRAALAKNALLNYFELGGSNTNRRFFVVWPFHAPAPSLGRDRVEDEEWAYKPDPKLPGDGRSAPLAEHLQVPLTRSVHRLVNQAAHQNVQMGNQFNSAKLN